MADDSNNTSRADDRGVHRWFVAIAFAMQVSFTTLYMVCTDYKLEVAQAEGVAPGVGTVAGTYSYYTDVAVMVFIGFGFLMTFLGKYAHSALGYTFLISCFVIEMAILVEAFIHSADAGDWHTVMVDLTSLVRGLFAAGAVMISFGAVLGRTTPMQLLLMAVVEVLFYGLNEWIGASKLRAVDMGGSMFVHEFGAFFGLAVSAMLPKQQPAAAAAGGGSGDKGGAAKGGGSSEADDSASRYDSDVSAMVGALFLWILWPSFNGALAPTPDSQMRVVVNTVFALCASCIAAFVFSHLTRRGKFNMVHVQNATLAGGVAIGSSSDLTVGPGGSMLVGTLAGAVSVLGYEYLSPWLERRLGLRDTCGVLNLHGVPGLIGALAGAVSCGVADSVVYGLPYEQLFSAGRSPANQWGFQLAAMGVTLGISVGGGLLAGAALRFASAGPARPFTDEFWDSEAPPAAAQAVAAGHGGSPSALPRTTAAAGQDAEAQPVPASA